MVNGLPAEEASLMADGLPADPPQEKVQGHTGSSHGQSLRSYG